MKRILSLILVLIIILAGCSSKSYDKAEYTNALARGEVTKSMNDYDTLGVAYGSRNNGIQDAEAPAMVETEKAEENNSQNIADNQKLIYYVDVTLETKNYKESIENLNNLITSYGGYVESSNIPMGEEYGLTAYFTARIPASQLDSFLGKTSEIGNKVQEQKNVENVTERYSDIESRLKTLRTKEERLLSLLSKAEKMEDIIKLESALSDTTYQIESYEGQKKGLDSKISYSIVHIDIRDVKEYTPIEYDKSLSGEIKKAFDREFLSFKKAMNNVIIDVLSIAPFFILRVLLFVFIPIVIIILIIRKIKKSRKAKIEKKNKIEIKDKDNDNIDDKNK